MKKVYVFGNEFLNEDAMAPRVASFLHGIIPVYCTSPEQLMDAGNTLIILDVVRNISKPALLTSIEKIKTRSLLSMHDFDVGFFLSLMDRMGMKKTVKIIGLPPIGDPQRFAREVQPWI